MNKRNKNVKGQRKKRKQNKVVVYFEETLLLTDNSGTERAYDSVEMRRPKVKDMRRSQEIEGTDIDKEIFLLANLTGLGEDEIDDMYPEHYNKLSGVLSNFLSSEEKPSKKEQS